MGLRRSVDWHPGTGLQVLRARAGMMRDIRAFFAARDVLEVETPLLSACFGTEPSIEPLRSEFVGPGYAQGLSLFLQSSPEFFMKRLLAAGSGPIYQICKAFRNGEAGKLHNPEFSILEWYRPGFDMSALINEVAELVLAVLHKSVPVERHRYADLFSEHLGIDVFNSDADALQALAMQHNLLGAEQLQLDRDGWLDLLMSSLIERQLGQDVLCFVTDYPASQASLARLQPHDERVAARFELYYQGVELANGFHELSDAAEQSQRFEHENCQRRSNGQQPMPIDDALLSALEQGIPDSSGVAIGLDRLLMCAVGAEELDQVMAFSLSRV